LSRDIIEILPLTTRTRNNLKRPHTGPQTEGLKEDLVNNTLHDVFNYDF